MFSAVKYQHDAAVTLLIAKGADVDAIVDVDDFANGTALLYLIYCL